MKVETFTPANVMKPIGPYSHREGGSPDDDESHAVTKD